MPPRSILVLGAGELGSSVIGHLADLIRERDDVSLTVLLRSSTIDTDDRKKRREVSALRALGVEVLRGDVTAPFDELVRLFNPFHTVISCTGFVGGPGTQVGITRAVLEAAVPRYIPWQFGVDYEVVGRGSGQEVWDEQLDVRDMLRAQSATRWIIVSTGMFTSFLFDPTFGVVDLDNSVVHALGGWDTSVTVTAPDDIGLLTAEICLAEPPILDQVVYTAGDTISYGRLAETVDRVLGRKLERVEWTVPWLRGQLADDPGDSIKQYRVAFADGKGVSWSMKQTFNVQRGIKIADVEQWMRQHIASQPRRP